MLKAVRWSGVRGDTLTVLCTQAATAAMISVGCGPSSRSPAKAKANDSDIVAPCNENGRSTRNSAAPDAPASRARKTDQCE